jgi:phosphoglycerate dehydrogenase-like enzyme
MQKKSENAAHAQDGIRPKKLKNSGACGIRHPHLLEALQSAQIAGAGLDVFEKEPLPSNSPFFGLPNVILTPHSAATTPETTEAGVPLAIDNIFRFIAGSPANIIS